MTCFGRTKKWARCQNPKKHLGFCPIHRWQPLTLGFFLLTVLGLLGGIYQDVWKPLFFTTQQRPPILASIGTHDTNTNESLNVVFALPSTDLPNVVNLPLEFLNPNKSDLSGLEVSFAIESEFVSIRQTLQNDENELFRVNPAGYSRTTNEHDDISLCTINAKRLKGLSQYQVLEPILLNAEYMKLVESDSAPVIPIRLTITADTTAIQEYIVNVSASQAKIGENNYYEMFSDPFPDQSRIHVVFTTKQRVNAIGKLPCYESDLSFTKADLIER